MAPARYLLMVATVGLSACGSSGIAGSWDPGTDVMDPAADVAVDGDPGEEDLMSTWDPGVPWNKEFPDRGPIPDGSTEDIGPEDLWVQDPGTVDPGQSDPGPKDPGTPDPGTPDPGGNDVSNDCGTVVPGLFPVPVGPGWAVPNAYSWDGSWTPLDGDFPMAGLLDNEYGDGHLWQGEPSPILPPGAWDWVDADDDLANWRNWEKNLGDFQKLMDHCDRHYGWKLNFLEPGAVDYAGAAEYFEGSWGTDVVYLGAAGQMHSISGYLDHGPDVLVFDEGWSLDFRTGPPLGGSQNDNDLVVMGCAGDPGWYSQVYDIHAATIHTGPGNDRVFARDLSAAAVDAGNGDGGNTSVLDPTDGDDLVVFRGSVQDARFFGGWGDDVLVWYVDEMLKPTPYSGGDYFGGGGAGEAVWGDPGTDRLVLAIPVGTPIVSKPATPPGSLLVMLEDTGYVDPWWDGPTVGDPYAKYCITCGTSPQGERTLFLQYVSANGAIDTGEVSVTAFEELQVGIGPGATVYQLDDVTGAVVADPSLVPYEPPQTPVNLCNQQ